MYKYINRSFMLFFQFLRRDFCRYKKQIKRYIVNFGIIRPLTFAISFAYIQANILFGTQQTHISTIFLIGNSMMILMVLTFSLMARLLFDLETDRFVEYQITIINPQLLLVQRIVFATLFAFCISLPFFPMSKLILWNYIDTSHTSWPKLFLILFVGALCLSAYNLLCSTMLKNPKSITSLWMRVNIPLLVLGGLWTPMYIIQSTAPKLSYLLYLNPIMYITEGLRHAMLGKNSFFSIPTCIAGLLILTTVFTAFSFYFFKKRVDHI